MTPERLFLGVIFPLLALYLAISLYSNGALCRLSRFCGPQTNQPERTPHQASWMTWYHPFQDTTESDSRSQSTNWNLFHHLGGYGPWIEKSGPEGEVSNLAPPDGCQIDQVHMMSRHAERYPTVSAGTRHLELLERINTLNEPLNGSLAFINQWSYITDNPIRDFGQLTSTGPYAGTLGAFTTGVRLRTRYADLISQNSTTRFWASDSQRVIETARIFAHGFFGLEWEERRNAELHIIPETFDRGADTLTPGDTCLFYLEDKTTGHDFGANMLARFLDSYIPEIALRLISENPALGKLDNMVVYSMQEMCGFEIMVRGSSPWCNVFTQKEWEHFAYARDFVHFYRAGPGNPYAGAMGWLWLNATANLLNAGPDSGSIFLSFVHDGDIAPFLTALGILSEPEGVDLPTTHIDVNRIWSTSSVLPMGARITLERLKCSSRGNTFVRFNVNDRIMALPSCNSGPGGSCELNQFMQYVKRRGEYFGDFGKVCGLEDHAERITFLRQSISGL